MGKVDPIHRRAETHRLIEKHDLLVGMGQCQPLNEIEFGANGPRTSGRCGLDRLDDELGRADQISGKNNLVLALGVNQNVDARHEIAYVGDRLGSKAAVN